MLHLLSPAKINWFLHILDQREDGYHNLQTVFQFLDLYDEITFAPRNDTRFTLTASGLPIPEGENLILRAAYALQERYPEHSGMDITLYKNIPIGGGLGGGSSNAATTLIALNHLWELNLNEDTLAEIGLSLGADVPVFVRGMAAFAEGIGEQLTPLPELPTPWYVILIPPCQISTQEIFSAKELTRHTQAIKIREVSFETTRNDCESVVRARYPWVDAALTWLAKFGQARLTGTGACVFAPFLSKDEATEVQKQVPEPFQAFIARGVNFSPLHAFWAVAKR